MIFMCSFRHNMSSCRKQRPSINSYRKECRTLVTTKAAQECYEFPLRKSVILSKLQKKWY